MTKQTMYESKWKSGEYNWTILLGDSAVPLVSESSVFISYVYVYVCLAVTILLPPHMGMKQREGKREQESITLVTAVAPQLVL